MSVKETKTLISGQGNPMAADGRGGSREVNRRTFLQLSALAAAGATVAGAEAVPAARAKAAGLGQLPLEEATIAELQAAMAAGRLTALELVDFYLARIDALDQHGPRVNSIIEVNPDARDIAQALDMERRAQGPRGPLHGIPVVLKDNIDTADRMLTTAGSLALVGDAPAQDATVAQRLRDAGAVILGKANLSEWANFRGFNSTSGFSGRGRLAVNPYALDRNACGSSSGSAAAVSANFCAAALGTETDGSIVCPSGACGVVGLKPTLGLTSRAGVIPIAHSQDVVGPHGRTVADVAAVLGALTGVDPRDPATAESEGRSFSDYTQFLDSNGLRGARIGVPRQIPFTYGVSRYVDAIMEDAIQAMTEAGAIIIDPAELPSNDDFAASFDEIIVLIYEFKRDLNAYLATRTGVPVHTLADVIAFNEAHAAQELQFFGQEIFELAEAEIFSEQDYLAALPRSKMLAGEQGIDAVMDQFKLDALVAPTGSLAWTTDLINGDHFLIGSSSFAAVAGYPNITVPAGSAFGLPVGISFFGRAYSEPTLIKLASGFEHAIQVRRPPQFLPTLPLDGASSSARHLNRSAPTVARPVRPFQPWAL